MTSWVRWYVAQVVNVDGGDVGTSIGGPGSLEAGR